MKKPLINTDPFEGLTFTKKEATDLKEARNIVLNQCKEENDNWDELLKASKECRMYKKALDLELNWHCVFIYEYIKRGMVK